MTRLNSIAALEGRQQYSARRIRRLRKLSSLAEILPTDDVSKEWRKILNAFHEADIKGEGQTVVIIDSGFDEKNPLIQKSIVMEKCFDFTGEGLSDKNGHGTMVIWALTLSAEPTLNTQPCLKWPPRVPRWP